MNKRQDIVFESYFLINGIIMMSRLFHRFQEVSQNHRKIISVTALDRFCPSILSQ